MYQKQIPNSYITLVCIDNRFTLPTKIFTGKNCINNFIHWNFAQQERINQIIKQNLNGKIKITIEDEKKYQDFQDCWICNEKLDETKEIIVI